MSVEIEGGVSELLKQESRLQEKEAYKTNQINWIDNKFYDSWDKIKGHTKNLLGSKSLVAEDYIPSLVFIAHEKDTIRGKPELIMPTLNRIPLIRATKKAPEDTDEQGKILSILFFDERFDKRYDGYQVGALSLDFWTYSLIDESGKKYIILSDKKLPNCTSNLRGMLIELDDFAEMSRTLKIKSSSRVFILKSFEPDIKILPPEELINLTSSKKITLDEWFIILGTHPLGTINRFPNEVEQLKSSFKLSGTYQGYPLHLGIMGTAGTNKSKGHAETTDYKFKDESSIFEGSTGRLKGLIPSYKEGVDRGYLAKAERIALVDEIGKLVEQESNKHQSFTTNILGELNPLYDHSSRFSGSGNGNLQIEATAKVLITTNPVKGHPTIYSHVGLIDPTFMSRSLWWVQDEEEVRFIREKGIVKLPPSHSQAYTTNKIKNRCIGLDLSWGKLSRNDFITIYDSCNNFLCNLDLQKIQDLVNETTLSAKEPMKGVWRPRAEHHIYLLVDGLVKTRCLFKDYDSSFTAKQEDYDLAKRILARMVKAWDTDLSPKQELKK